MKKAIVVKHNIIVDIIASLLLIFFVHTIVGSYIELERLKSLLGFYTINTSAIAWIIVFAECITAALIFFPKTRLIGFIASLIMITFAGITILRYPNFPHDFGGIFNGVSHSQKWLLIIFIALLSVIGTLLSFLKKKHSPPLNGEDHIVFT